MSSATPGGRPAKNSHRLSDAAHCPGLNDSRQRAAHRPASFDYLQPHVWPHLQAAPHVQVVGGVVLTAWQPQVQPGPEQIAHAHAFELVGFDLVVMRRSFCVG